MLEAAHQFTWDAVPNGIGQLASLSTPTHSLAYAYDSASRLSQLTQLRGTVALSVQWLHDPQTGQLSRLTYPSGAALTYQYDATGRPVSLSWAVSAVLPTMPGGA